MKTELEMGFGLESYFIPAKALTMNDQNIKWQWPNPHLKETTVLPEHTDRLGHTNNVRYLEWLEGIAWSHIESLGCGWEVKEQLGKAMAIVRTEIDQSLCLAQTPCFA